MAFAQQLALLMVFVIPSMSATSNPLSHVPFFLASDLISGEDDFMKCQSIVGKWANSSLEEEVEENKDELKDLLFFLHVPRTGGRTYYDCFLRKLYTTHKECPTSYDKLRFDPSKPNCRLMVSHDDYSMMSRFPKDTTSVVTIIRSPIDRVLSAYEFSVEVAARFLEHSSLAIIGEWTKEMQAKREGLGTLDIWPWKYLVPWMREDLFARVKCPPQPTEHTHI